MLDPMWHHSVLWIQREQVSLPDGEKGSLSCICGSIFDFKAVVRDEIPVGHEDGGCLVIGID